MSATDEQPDSQPPGRMPRLAVGLALVAGLVVLELALRILDTGSGYYPHYPNTVTVRYPTEEITPGVTGDSFFTTNSLGTRGPEYSGEDFSIITVGGSTTACSTLNDDEAWPHLVMERLNRDAAVGRSVWVTNSGINGLNVHHHVMHAQYLFPRIPNLDLAIFYAGVNDVGRWLYNTEFDPDFLDDEANWQSTLSGAFRDVRPASDPWYKHTRIFNRLSVAKAKMASVQNRTRDDEGHIIEDENLEWIEKERARRAKAEKRHIHVAKRETLPIALAEYRENLARIIELSRANGVEPVFMAHPIVEMSDDPDDHGFWMGAMDRGEAYVKIEEFAEVLAEYNACMKEVAAEYDALFIDLPEALRQVDGEVFYDSAHLNEHGAREVARIVADFLIDHKFKKPV